MFWCHFSAFRNEINMHYVIHSRIAHRQRAFIKFEAKRIWLHCYQLVFRVCPFERIFVFLFVLFISREFHNWLCQRHCQRGLLLCELLYAYRTQLCMILLNFAGCVCGNDTWQPLFMLNMLAFDFFAACITPFEWLFFSSSVFSLLQIRVASRLLNKT